MKLFHFKHYYDYGHELEFDFLSKNKFKFFSVRIHHADFWAWHYLPKINLNFALFDRALFDIGFSFLTISGEISFLRYNY
jgi:hypothetical protein